MSNVENYEMPLNCSFGVRSYVNEDDMMCYEDIILYEVSFFCRVIKLCYTEIKFHC